MVTSAQESVTSSHQPPDPLTVGPTPPPPDLITFPVSKPRSSNHHHHHHPHAIKSDTPIATELLRPWNLRSRNGASSVAVDRKVRPRFSVTLSCDEIAEDIYAVTGSLPRRRPKKRPRLLQKQIEMVFPGSWLKEITQELYKAP